MTKFTTLVSGAAFALALIITPASAKNDDSEAVIGALLLLGAAALAHHEDHHSSGKHHTQTQQIHDFDRGYSDGLHDAEYDFRYDSPEYNDGFAAGQKERHNRLAHRHPNRGEGPNAPILSMRACVGEASARWGRNPRDIRIVKTKQAGTNDFYVEVAAGRRHGNCEVSSQGKIFLFKRGRI